MKTVGITELRTRLGLYIDLAQKEPILITRRGMPVAVLIGVESRDREQLMRRLGAQGSAPQR